MKIKLPKPPAPAGDPAVKEFDDAVAGKFKKKRRPPQNITPPIPTRPIKITPPEDPLTELEQ